MEKVVIALVQIVSIPLILLNVFGGIISGILLAIGGDWTPLLLGIIFMLFGAFIVGLLMLPSLLIAGLAIFFANRRGRIGVGLCVLASQALIYAIMFGVSYSIFGFMLSFDNEANKLILLIWGFAVAIAPWSFMASKEQSNEGTQLTLFASQTGLLIILLMIGFLGYDLDEAFALVTTLTIIPILLTSAYAVRQIHNSGESLLIDNNTAKNSRFTQQELIAFVVCLLYIAQSDNHFHVNEIKQVRQCFYEVTGERISKSFIERIYRALDTGIISAGEIMSEAQESISEEMKQNIVLGSYRISKADGEITPEEREAIKEIGQELGLSGQDILNILKT